MGMFKKGYEANRQEKERQEKLAENRGKRLFRFFLAKDGDEADLIFLTEEPVNFQEHNVKGSRNGKDVFNQYTCTQDDKCELCNDGDRPSFKGAFLVWDCRPFEYTDKNGKKQQAEGSLKLFVYGTKVISQLDRISTKYGLSGRTITMVRLGSGTSTNYTFERGDKVKLTEQEIKNMLPEKLRDTYDGTEDSLYQILEEQLEMNIKGYTGDSSDDSDEEDDYDGRDSVMGVDDEEEGERPARKLSSGGKKLSKPAGKKKSLFKPQNSVKKNPQSKAKSLMKKSVSR
jgi:hypothetical protein